MTKCNTRWDNRHQICCCMASTDIQRQSHCRSLCPRLQWMLTCLQQQMHNVLIAVSSCTQQCIGQVILPQGSSQHEGNAANMPTLSCTLNQNIEIILSWYTGIVSSAPLVIWVTPTLLCTSELPATPQLKTSTAAGSSPQHKALVLAASCTYKRCAMCTQNKYVLHLTAQTSQWYVATLACNVLRHTSRFTGLEP